MLGMIIILALRRLRQEDHGFQVSLVYIETVKKKKKKKRKKRKEREKETKKKK